MSETSVEEVSSNLETQNSPLKFDVSTNAPKEDEEKNLETPAASASSQESKAQDLTKPYKEAKFLGLFARKDFTAYVGAGIYGFWESMQVMHPKTVTGIGMVSSELTHPRAQEGIGKLFEQHVGDGTIVALGFLGAEAVSLSVEKVAQKLGHKGFDPKVRFLSSLAFGVGMATYLETTHIMGNTVDIPGDLFGVGLGAAAILASKVIGDHVTNENVTKISEKTKSFIAVASEKFHSLSKVIANKLQDKEALGGDNAVAESISQEFLIVVDEANIDTNQIA